MKRETKSQREARERAELLQRIDDIATGAKGDRWDYHADEWATAEFLARFVPALQAVFGIAGGEWMFAARTLGHFDNPKLAAAFLYAQGIRA